MAFKQCRPGDKNAYGYIWIDGQQHEIVDPEATTMKGVAEKVTDKGGGKFSLDKSESAYIEVTFRRLPSEPPHEYERLRCVQVQYQDRDFLYTIPEAAFMMESYKPGDGEQISGKFLAINATEISRIRVS